MADPGLDQVVLYITDQHVPKPKRQASQLDHYVMEKPYNDCVKAEPQDVFK